MAFNVRIFGYKGIAQMPMLHGRQYTADSVFLLDEPYVFSEVLSVGAVAVLSAANPDPSVTLLRIEVPDAQAVRYRIIPAGGGYLPTDADTTCPRISGFDNFRFAPNWRVSLIDAAGLP